MRERDFSIYNAELDVRIDGGRLWQALPHEEEHTRVVWDEDKAQLSLYLHPNDTAITIQEALMKYLRALSWQQYCFFQVQRRLPSLLLLLPISLTVLFIAFITVWGDLVINWVFLGENANTVFGLPMNESAIIYALLAVVVIYFFPVLFTGEQEGFVEALNERFFNREALRKRLVLLLNALKNKGVLKRVVLWNPELGNEQLDWVGQSLLPALMDVEIPLHLQTRIDERRSMESYFEQRAERTLEWREELLPEVDPADMHPIPYSYLLSWEKSLLGVYVFASTANLPLTWRQLEGSLSDGVLHRTVSLRLVKLLVNQFKERLFIEEDLGQLISLDLFASRCVNDYGILGASLRHTHEVWSIALSVVEAERSTVEGEMTFLRSYLQTEADVLLANLNDPVAALLLNSVQLQVSIYNEDRLAAIQFFVDVIYAQEQYKILKQYWTLLLEQPPEATNSSQDIYRIIGVPVLLQLATIFERAALYDLAYDTLEYLERVFPFRGKVGKARILERQGDFEASVRDLLVVLDDWEAGRIVLKDESVVDLTQNIAWAIVSGRLVDQRVVGQRCLAQAQTLLNQHFDSLRNSEQTIRFYNITANYEEWLGRPEGAINNYDKALQIPGGSQSGVSNLLVNKGIALRQLGRLKEAALYGEQGVGVKTAIGDADQLPIAQHNLAQTYLEQAQATRNREEQAHCWRQAQRHAANGLHIQVQTGSIKKRGQLLTEYFLGCWNLRADGGELAAVWTKVQHWLSDQQVQGNAQTYDCRVVVEELLGSQAPWKGMDLKALLDWMPE